MCSGDRLVADFVAGTRARPSLPAQLEEHLTTTTDGLWVVWAYKLARQVDDLFIPLTRGPGYPADATATCKFRGQRGAHNAPDPLCTCGFHAIAGQVGLDQLVPSAWRLGGGFVALTVALSGRVLAFEWARGGVLWRAERQTVVRVERPAAFDRATRVLRFRRPGDPDGRPAVVPGPAPRDWSPVRLNLPVSSPVLPVCHDDAGWCVEADTLDRSQGLVLA